MLGIVSALFAAMVYGLSAVLVRKRLAESNFLSATRVITVIGNIVLWPLALIFTNFKAVNLEGIPFLVVGGMLAPAMTGLFYFKGVEAVGVSVNASIFATFPMFSSIFAVLLLSEALSTENCIGIICIVVGAVLVERSLSKHENGSKRNSKKGLVFPLLASLAVASSYVIRKHGLTICNEPLLGAAIGYSVSLILHLILVIFFHTARASWFSGKDFQLFWKAGVSMSMGIVLVTYAVSNERVSIVAPIEQTEPLFILFFAYLYLKESEHISFKLIISTLLIVIGVMLVSIR